MRALYQIICDGALGLERVDDADADAHEVTTADAVGDAFAHSVVKLVAFGVAVVERHALAVGDAAAVLLRRGARRRGRVRCSRAAHRAVYFKSQHTMASS